jgi:transcriptional regulator with XRE-family HTH domain
MNVVYHVPMSTSDGAPATVTARVAATAPTRRGAKAKNEKKVTFLTQRLDFLFETVHPKGRGPYSFQEVADGILAAVGPDSDGTAPISSSYIWNLRAGHKENPTRRHIALLAAFFGVSPLFFFEDEYELGIEQMEIDRILRDPKVLTLTRAAAGLSDTSLDAVTTLATSLHAVERNAREGQATAD